MWRRVRMRTRESPTAQAHMSPRGRFHFFRRRQMAPDVNGNCGGTCGEGVPGHEDGCDVSLYRTIATAVGTREALDLAHRLAVWHDAMVMHRRRAGEAAGLACEVDCPHDQAESLWLEAVDVYGDRAHDFAFLRSHGRVSNRPERAGLCEMHL